MECLVFYLVVPRVLGLDRFALVLVWFSGEDFLSSWVRSWRSTFSFSIGLEGSVFSENVYMSPLCIKEAAVIIIGPVLGGLPHVVGTISLVFSEKQYQISFYTFGIAI